MSIVALLLALPCTMMTKDYRDDSGVVIDIQALLMHAFSNKSIQWEELTYDMGLSLVSI